MTWRVICDFDGTISIKDTTDQLLERFADPAWHSIEDEWIAGSIGSAECMRRQTELLQVSKENLDAWIASIAIDDTFIDFVALCERKNIDISIASDGIDYVIHGVLARHGLSHLRVTANHLQFLEGNRYSLASYNKLRDCKSGSGVCKCGVAEVAANQSQSILYVGDGRSDFCVSHQVAVVAAKATLLTYCQQHELPHVAFQNFSHVAKLLTNLIQPTRILAPASEQRRFVAA